MSNGRGSGRVGFLVDRVAMALVARLRLDTLIMRLHWAGLTRSRQGPAEPANGCVVVIAAPASGNIGDAAMEEAVVRRIGASAFIVGTGAEPVASRGEAIPDLVYPRRFTAFLRANRRLRALARECAGVAVIGADMMDAGYSPAVARRRWAIVTDAARTGRDARVFGFSWNGRAVASVARAAQRAARAGVRLYARDPVSLRRLQAGSIAATPAADVVFTRAGQAPDLSEERFRRLAGVDPGTPIAVVNASALVARTVPDQADQYARLVRALNARGLHCVLVPHVLRSSANDLDECIRVGEAADGARFEIIRERLSPETVQGLVRTATVVVSGRMHLAIMALGEGVPAVTVGTQGKVEGLMELVGRPSLCVAPSPHLGDDLVREVEAVLETLPAVRESIARRIPELRRLAERNFDGISEES